MIDMRTKEKTKVLITGASGVLGKKISKFLSNYSEYEIINLVRSKNNQKKIFKKNLQIIESDIKDISFLKKKISEIDIVLHLAFPNSKSNFSEKEILDIVKLNTNFFNLMTQKKVKKFIYISTSKIKIYEKLINATLSNYEICKLRIEKSLLKLAESSNTNLIILRSGIVYGSDIKNNFSKYVEMIKKRKRIPLIKETVYKNIIYIDYFLKGIYFILNQKKLYKKPIYLYERNLNLQKVTLKIQTILKIKNKIIYIPNMIIKIMKIFGLYKIIFRSLYDSFYIDEESVYKVDDDKLNSKLFDENLINSFDL